MAKYRVGFYYDISGFMEVTADSADDAQTKVKNILEEEGIDDEAKVDVVGRDYATTGIFKEYACTK